MVEQADERINGARNKAKEVVDAALDMVGLSNRLQSIRVPNV